MQIISAIIITDQGTMISSCDNALLIMTSTPELWYSFTGAVLAVRMSRSFLLTLKSHLKKLMERLVNWSRHNQALNLGKDIARAQNRPLNKEEAVRNGDDEGPGTGG